MEKQFSDIFCAIKCKIVFQSSLLFRFFGNYSNIFPLKSIKWKNFDGYFYHGYFHNYSITPFPFNKGLFTYKMC